MLDMKTFASAVAEIAEERGIAQEKIFEVIEEAIASAYKKEYGKKRQKITAKLNPKTGELSFWQIKQAVDETMIFNEEEIEEMRQKQEAQELAGESSQATERTFGREGEAEENEDGRVRFNPERHIMMEEAKKIDKEIKAGEELKLPLESKEEFGRIAAQTAKQVILQKIKEAEKEETYKEFKEKEGEVVSGIVQRIEPMAVFLDIGRASGVLPQKEQVRGENYRSGQRLKLYVLATEQSPKGPQIILSRIYPKLISKLFELEVPEISAGQVEIKSIAREAGSRSKVAVQALEEGIDPIGSMVGQRGTRILAVTNELNGEKIDVIEWHQETAKFIASALSPAKVLEVKILPKNKAQAIIPDDQLSLAIGKDGQNVRLAAKLTGWKIDVRSAEQAEQELKEQKMAPIVETEKPAKPEVKIAEPEEKPAKKEKTKKAKKEKKAKPVKPAESTE